MSDRLRRVAGWVIAGLALVTIVVGLLPEAAEADPEQRERRLAERIACPWCDGQSLAESDSQVARDLVLIVRERIDDGWTDAEIYDFFASSYGEQVLLDPPLTGWGLALWLVPSAALLVGGWVIWKRRTT
ncbi:MAG: cytochrome c-type biogenesis protein CcmH [Acidimicrobiia bacterium]|nr:cytochrome c-type biogenesis protein CcmH [Acidimicrobiia bacterium]